MNKSKKRKRSKEKVDEYVDDNIETNVDENNGEQRREKVRLKNMVKNAYESIPETDIFYFFSDKLYEILEELDFTDLSAVSIKELANNIEKVTKNIEN